MKNLGIILLIIGALSLLAGIVSPSDGDPTGVILGYFLKFALIISGIVLISRKKPSIKNNNLHLSTTENKSGSNTYNINNDIRSTPNEMLKIEENESNQLLKKIEFNESELLILKAHNLLTDEEFEIKKRSISKRKEEITQELNKIKLDQEIERVKSIVNEDIKALISILENTLKSGLLTQEEFDSKKLQLFNEKYNSIFSVPYLNPTFQLKLDLIKENALKDRQKETIVFGLRNFKIGDVYTYSKADKKLFKYTSEEFIKLNNSYEASEYKYLEIPNFLSRLGFPYLQKEVGNKVYLMNRSKYEFAIKPEQCPNCGSKDIIAILYGLPIFTPKLEAEIKEGNVILGGCMVSPLTPIWRCKDCKTNIYKPTRNSSY
jgi:hypothetical protein